MSSQRFFLLASFLVSSLFGFHSNAKAETFKLRVTNTTARKLKISWGCKSNDKITKQGSKEFPGSKGETKSFTSTCSQMYLKMQAKIVTNWKKARIYYDTSGVTLPPKDTLSATFSSSSTGYVSYIYLGARSTETRICLYVYESGIVKAFPRQCP